MNNDNNLYKFYALQACITLQTTVFTKMKYNIVIFTPQLAINQVTPVKVILSQKQMAHKF